MRTTTTVAGPGFIADYSSIDRLNGGRQIDWAAVPENMRTTAGQTVKLAAAALAAAVALVTDPLEGPIAAGTVLDFTGVGKFARTTADAAAGATALAVEALPEALADNDEAIVQGAGNKFLPAGTRVEPSTNDAKLVMPVVTAANTIGILETNAEQDNKSDAKTGYGIIIGGVIFESLLPGATGTPRAIAAGEKTALKANGTGFVFQSYADDRAS